MRVTGHFCTARIYEFEGWLFEASVHSGPWPLRKDWEPRKRAGRKFWAMWERFDKLSDMEKREYKIAGGCIPL